MLRLTGNRKTRIPDRLAVIAALLLVVSSLAGLGNSALSSSNGEATQVAAVTDSAPFSRNSGSSPTVKKNRGFKTSLFLFRNR